MEHIGFVSTDLKKKYKNTQNTWPVHLFFYAEEKHKNTQNTKGVALCICPLVAEEKHKNTQNTKRVAPVLFGPHHTLTTKPKKYKKNKPNKTSPQYCLLAHLHQGVKKYKNTQWLTIFFSYSW